MSDDSGTEKHFYKYGNSDLCWPHGPFDWGLVFVVQSKKANRRIQRQKKDLTRAGIRRQVYIDSHLVREILTQMDTREAWTSHAIQLDTKIGSPFIQGVFNFCRDEGLITKGGHGEIGRVGWQRADVDSLLPDAVLAVNALPVMPRQEEIMSGVLRQYGYFSEQVNRMISEPLTTKWKPVIPEEN